MTDATITAPFFQSAIAQLQDYVGRTLYVATRQSEGVTHDESLTQLPFRGNCMNWVLGHVLVTRGMMLAEFGAEAPLNDAQTARYVTGSEPITDDDDAVMSLDNLLAQLEQTTEHLKDLFASATPEQFSEVVDEEKHTTRLQKLQGLAWHETYHIGQLEHLRQAAGKDDHIF